jgi:hypothetical protein
MTNPEPIVLQINAEDNTGDALSSVNREAQKNQRYISNLEKKYKKLADEVGLSGDELEDFRLAQAGATKAQLDNIKALRQQAQAMDAVDDAQDDMKQGLRLMRGGLGQVGHQIQDVVVQAQMGQNAFLILGQQGSQVASLFGQNGAMIGALLAVGAAFGTFIQASQGGSDAVERLIDRGEELSNLFGGILKENAEGITDELRDMANESRELALLSLTLAKLDWAQQQADSTEMLEKNITALNGAYVTMRTNQDNIGRKSATKVVMGVEALEAQFTLTREEAVALNEALINLSDGSQASTEAFSRLVRPIIAVRDASDPLVEIVANIDRSARASREAKQNLEDIAIAMNEITSAPNFDVVDEEAQRNIERAAQTIETIENKFTKGAAAITNKYMRALQQASDAHDVLGSSFQERHATEMILMEQMYQEQAALTAKRDEARQKLIDAEAKDTARRVRLINGIVVTESDAIAKINQLYDGKRQRVVDAINEEQDVTAAAAVKLVEIEAGRQRALADYHRKDVMRREEAAEKQVQAEAKAKQQIEEMMDDGTQKFLNNLATRFNALREARAKDIIDEEEFLGYRKQLQTEYADHMLDEQFKIAGGIKHVEDSFADASHAFITGAQNGTEALQSFGRAIVDEVIKGLVLMGVEHVKQAMVRKKVETAGLATSVAANAGAMSAIAVQAAPAAALVSLATAGGNAAPAITGMATAANIARILAMQSFEGGGFTGYGARSGGMDGRGGFLAMLHPNESVIDHSKGGNGGVTIVNNITTEGGGDVDQKIAIAVTEASQQTVMAIQDLRRRGRL